jgi:hypothetical protein
MAEEKRYYYYDKNGKLRSRLIVVNHKYDNKSLKQIAANNRNYHWPSVSSKS